MSGDSTRVAARVAAIEALLVERGVVGTEAIDAVVSAYENDIGPMLGARVVAHAWADDEFRDRVVEDATAASRELGIGGMAGEHMRVMPNTSSCWNVIVCTLCSCYPWPVLGLPPNWYRNPSYRARIVRDPRRTLREAFELEIPDEIEIRVWDSSSELRYFVLPERPEGTEGMSEDQLAGLVTRESMLGVGRPLPAEAVA